MTNSSLQENALNTAKLQSLANCPRIYSKSGIDFEQKYSVVIDCTSYRYLLNIAVQHALETWWMDVVTSYLYDELDTELYIKPPPDFLPHSKPSPTEQFSGLQICKALCELKQAGRVWYHLFKTYLMSHGFSNHPALPCVFVIKFAAEFIIFAVYVDDLNSIGTPNLSRQIEWILTK